MANGKANAVWVSQTAVAVPARLKSGMSVTMISVPGMDQCAPPENICSSGSRATWLGKASSDTVPMKIHSRPRNGIHAKAYAAKAAMAIGMIVAGMAIANELSSACHSPPV